MCIDFRTMLAPAKCTRGRGRHDRLTAAGEPTFMWSILGQLLSSARMAESSLAWRDPNQRDLDGCKSYQGGQRHSLARRRASGAMLLRRRAWRGGFRGPLQIEQKTELLQSYWERLWRASLPLFPTPRSGEVDKDSRHSSSYEVLMTCSAEVSLFSGHMLAARFILAFVLISRQAPSPHTTDSYNARA